MGRAVIPLLGGRQPLVLIGIAGAVVVAACALPLARLCAEVVSNGLASFAVFAQPRLWLLLGGSMLAASAVTLIALTIGVAFGFLVARADLPGRSILWALHAFPFFLSPFLLALGWFQIFGEGSLVSGPRISSVLFSQAGLVAILSLAFAPVATSLVALALLGVDASLEEAARVSARPWRVARRILIPAIRPAIVLAAVVVFTLTISEIGVPMFLRVDSFSAAVFARLGGLSYAPAEALALTLPLLAIALVLLAIERRFAGPGTLAVAGLRGMSRAPLPLGRWRGGWTAAAWAIAVLGVVPLVGLTLPLWAAADLGDVSSAWGRAPWTSLAAALPAALLIGGVSVIVGHAIARRSRAARAIDALAMLAFLVPAPVLGAGLIAVWAAGYTPEIYGSLAIFVVGFVARYSAVGVRSATAVISQRAVALEEAAAANGAGYWMRLTTVVVGSNRAAIASVALLAAVFCLRDFETAVLYYPPGLQPLTVRIFTLEANGSPAAVAALATAQVVLTAAVCGAALWFATRPRSAA